MYRRSAVGEYESKRRVAFGGRNDVAVIVLRTHGSRHPLKCSKESFAYGTAIGISLILGGDGRVGLCARVSGFFFPGHWVTAYTFAISLTQ